MNYSEKINSLLEEGILPTPEMVNEEEMKEDAEYNQDNDDMSDEDFILNQIGDSGVDEKNKDTSVKVIYSYNKPSKKRTVNDFVSLFNHRFKALERMIKVRPEMEGIVSINKLKMKNERDTVSIIGMVNEKSFTKNKHIILLMEDLTGQHKVLISKNNKEIYDIAKDIVLDEVMGVSGVCGKDIIFANNLVFPDIPLTLELKKAPKEKYAVFISDVHIGSKEFLESG